MLVTTMDAVDSVSRPNTSGRRKSFSQKEKEGFRRVWDKLQGDEHNLDLARAQLLHKVWTRFDRNDANLTTFMIEVLEEYKGKRVSAFVRLVHAYENNNNATLWRSIGGKGMVMLVRTHDKQRREIINRVRDTLKRTKREALSLATFRTIARDVLGACKYKKILTEGDRAPGCREQLAVLRDFLLRISKVPAVKQALTPRVIKALGLDLVQ